MQKIKKESQSILRKHCYRWIEGWTDRRTYVCMDRWKDGQTERQTDRTIGKCR